MNDRMWDRFSGIVVGAAVGFIAGVLLAPTSGEETRGQLKRRTQDSVGQVKVALTDLRENISKRSRNLVGGGATEIELQGADGPEGEGA